MSSALTTVPKRSLRRTIPKCETLAFFFLLGAEFVGLVQVFVHVGAVAVLIVFTILLSRGDADPPGKFNWGGVVVAIAVFAGLVWAILRTSTLAMAAAPIDALTVKRIG